MGKVKRKGDVYWYLPNKKKPIAYSTKVVSDTISVFSKEYKTVNDVYRAIGFLGEEKEILEIYIRAGYGNADASELFY